MSDIVLDSPAAPRIPEPVPGAPVTEGLPDLVQWSEGMLLSPQHLQQNDVYWQEQLRYRSALIAPDGWGLAALEYDAAALQEGRLRIVRLEALMPDGTPVVFPGSYVEALEVDLHPALARQAGSVRVSLVLPARSGASTRRDASLRRYDLVQGAWAIDENTGVGTVPVDRLRPRISLWAGNGIPAQYVACPLLEVARNAGSRVVETGCYHPPLLRWQAADVLGRRGLRRRLQNLSDALWLKLRELAGNRGDDAPEDEATGATLRPAMEAARRLAAVLPHFTLVATRPDAKPVQVYDALSQLVGAMAAFGQNPIPPVLDAYQHANCEPQFRRALEYVVRKLAFINSRYEFLEFRRDGQRFSQVLPTQAGSEVLVELRLPDDRPVSPSDQQAMERWLQDAWIASKALFDDAARARVRARVRALKPDEVAQRGLRPGAAVFALGEEWLEFDGQGRRQLLQPGQELVIEGTDGQGLPPAHILLHQPRARGAQRALGAPDDHENP